MPIRFRCAYCNQLMGIARRKAGTVVRCPNCAGQVIVPTPAGEASAPQTPTPKSSAGPLIFEDDDIDKLFEPKALEPAPAKPSNPPPAIFPTEAPVPAFDVQPVTVSRQRNPGILLTPATLTVLGICIVLVIGLAFLLGFMIGRQ
jgi:hypothetical protein